MRLFNEIWSLLSAQVACAQRLWASMPLCRQKGGPFQITFVRGFSINLNPPIRHNMPLSFRWTIDLGSPFALPLNQMWVSFPPVQNLPGWESKLVDIVGHTGRPRAPLAPPGRGQRVQGQALPPSAASSQLTGSSYIHLQNLNAASRSTGTQPPPEKSAAMHISRGFI